MNYRMTGYDGGEAYYIKYTNIGREFPEECIVTDKAGVKIMFFLKKEDAEKK